MKSYSRRQFPVVALLVLFSTIFASGTLAQVPAFPGADGFGRYASGGRGGKVYYVTKLTDDGSEGTLRKGVGMNNVTIMFKVSGTIHLKSSLSITGGNITIAGQSAPGDGICLAEYPVFVSSSNVIVRYMRFRMGDYSLTADEADGADAFGGRFCDNVILDHCSVSWSTDECCSFYANSNFTMQWCLIAESLRQSLHSKGAHGYGAIWGGIGASYYHNMLIHHDSRTPRFGTYAGDQNPNAHLTDWRNNVVYNWSGNGCYGCEGMFINTINNYYRPGGATTSSTKAKFMMPGYATSTDGTTAIWGKLYFDGNKNDLYTEVNSNNWKGVTWTNNSSLINGVATQADLKSDTILGRDRIPLFHQHSTDSGYIQVLNYVGCCKSRDALDTRYVSECKSRTTTFKGASAGKPGIIDKCNDLKPKDAGDDWTPWPELKSTEAPTDTDGDGMPDEWEIANGLDPNNVNDGNKKDSEGYTMLEVYLASLVADITKNQYEGSTEMGIPAKPYDPQEYSTDVTIKWPMTSVSDQNGVIDNPDAVKSATYSLGPELKYDGTKGFDGRTMVKIMPKTEYKQATEDATVTFNINLSEGTLMKPSKINVVAYRDGTDGSSLDIAWVDSKGKTTTLLKSVKPLRNNNDSKGKDPTITADLSTAGIDNSDGECQMKIYIYNLATSKSILLGDVEIGGELTTPAGIKSVAAEKEGREGAIYDINGIRVDENHKGIIIKNGKKTINR